MAKRKNKKGTGLLKDYLGWKLMSKFVGIRATTCTYLIHDGSEDKKAKGT